MMYAKYSGVSERLIKPTTRIYRASIHAEFLQPQSAVEVATTFLKALQHYDAYSSAVMPFLESGGVMHEIRGLNFSILEKGSEDEIGWVLCQESITHLVSIWLDGQQSNSPGRVLTDIATELFGMPEREYPS